MKFTTTLVLSGALALGLGACGNDSAATLEDLPATGSSAPSEQSADPAAVTDEAAAPAPTSTAAIDPSTGYVDPVCRMKVAEDAPYRHTHDGVTYGFCSASCGMKFATDADAYLIAMEE